MTIAITREKNGDTYMFSSEPTIPSYKISRFLTGTTDEEGSGVLTHTGELNRTGGLRTFPCIFHKDGQKLTVELPPLTMTMGNEEWFDVLNQRVKIVKSAFEKLEQKPTLRTFDFTTRRDLVVGEIQSPFGSITIERRFESASGRSSVSNNPNLSICSQRLTATTYGDGYGVFTTGLKTAKTLFKRGVREIYLDLPLLEQDMPNDQWFSIVQERVYLVTGAFEALNSPSKTPSKTVTYPN